MSKRRIETWKKIGSDKTHAMHPNKCEGVKNVKETEKNNTDTATTTYIAHYIHCRKSKLRSKGEIGLSLKCQYLCVCVCVYEETNNQPIYKVEMCQFR